MDERGGPLKQKVLSIVSKRSFLVLISIFYLFTFFLSAYFSNRWGYYQLFFSINFILYLGLVLSLSRSEITADLLKKKWSFIPLFLIPFILQLFLLMFEPSFSQDIMRLQFRGEALLDGLTPYEDFEINKPPLYIWMVASISHLLGPDPLSFRLVFIIFNSLIPPIMWSIGKIRTSPMGIGWDLGAAAYALWPVALIETGIAGHFDPVVATLVLLSFLFLSKSSNLISGIFLGAGFALKMFPIILTPFFFFTIKKWKGRSMFFLGFFIVPVLSALPFIIRDPSGIFGYLIYQSSGWGSSNSFQFILDILFNEIGLMEGLSFLLATLLLIIGTILLISRGKGKHSHVIMIALSILSIIPLGYFLSILLIGTKGPLLILGILPITLTISSIIFSILLWSRKRENNIPNIFRIKEILTWSMDSKNLTGLSALALILLLITSAQFHPWYLIWIAPFAIAASPRIGWTFLIMSGPLHFNSYPPWDMGGMF